MENNPSPSTSSDDCHDKSQTLEYDWEFSYRHELEHYGSSKTEDKEYPKPANDTNSPTKSASQLGALSSLDSENKQVKSSDNTSSIDNVVCESPHIADEDTSPPFIKTFVFVDVETTDLISHNKPMPRITEIAMVAVHRKALVSLEDIRLKDKLLLCVDPITEINRRASEITQLSNDILKGQEKQEFNTNILITIRHFIKRQSPPVCLVAHNGDTFDFKVLKSELERLSGKFENILCGDTLTAMIARRDRQEAKGCIEGFPSPKHQKGDLTLQTLYSKHVGTLLVNAHCAEDDAIALMKIVQKQPDILEWLDNHAVPFDSIQVPRQVQIPLLITPPSTPLKRERKSPEK
ncbi:three prime repair exonuclease 2-like [Glandiceps talaboti]